MRGPKCRNASVRVRRLVCGEFMILVVGVKCVNIGTPPFYRCGQCPVGHTGNGTSCIDLDEVSLNP